MGDALISDCDPEVLLLDVGHLLQGLANILEVLRAQSGGVLDFFDVSRPLKILEGEVIDGFEGLVLVLLFVAELHRYLLWTSVPTILTILLHRLCRSMADWMRLLPVRGERLKTAILELERNTGQLWDAL